MRADRPPRGAEPIRLQRFLAAAGFGGRRHCEELIVTGRVAIDGHVVERLGTRIDPSQATISVDGVRVRPKRKCYYAVHKPIGVLSTHRDPGGRTRVIDLVPRGEQLFTVGRLDRNSEGLMLVTNDGELANGLAHPRYGVGKTYRVEVAGSPTPEVLRQWREGVHLAEGFVHATQVHVVRRRRQSTILEVVLREGKNREIRRMAARVGHKVLSLQRIALGPLRLGDLPEGAFRELQRAEIDALYRAVQRPSKPSRRAAAGSPSKARRPHDRVPTTKGRLPAKSRPAGSPKPKTHSAAKKGGRRTPSRSPQRERSSGRG